MKEFGETTNRIVVYLRVSTDKQETANQRFEVEKFLVKRGFENAEWVEDIMSGKTEVKDRRIGPVLEKLKKGDTLIVTEISRLSRSLFHIMEIMQYCLKNEIKIYTVKEGYELGDNITAKVMAFAFGIAAEIERNLISQRTKEALARKKSEGVILGRPKGRKSDNKKLDKHVAEINHLLSKKVSISAIGRLIGAHRLTVTTYIENNPDKFCLDNEKMD